LRKENVLTPLIFLTFGLFKVEEKSFSIKKYLSYQVKNITIVPSRKKKLFFYLISRIRLIYKFVILYIKQKKIIF
jgi:hypothetical protein